MADHRGARRCAGAERTIGPWEAPAALDRRVSFRRAPHSASGIANHSTHPLIKRLLIPVSSATVTYLVVGAVTDFWFVSVAAGTLAFVGAAGGQWALGGGREPAEDSSATRRAAPIMVAGAVATVVLFVVSVAAVFGIGFGCSSDTEPAAGSQRERFCGWVNGLSGTDLMLIYILLAALPLVTLTGGVVGARRRQLAPLVLAFAVSLAVLVALWVQARGFP